MNSISDWLRKKRENLQYSLDDITLEESQEWQLKDGAIVHESGHFFSLIAVEWESEGIKINKPFIRQEEIGTLGFLLREGEEGREIYVYAKTEPGNIELVQLAPSIQATWSNSNRFHGGESPPCLEYFQNQNDFLTNTLQSEQGMRFYRKRNRNVLKFTQEDIQDSDTHRWFPIEELLSMLHEDFTVNTDARSVLVTAPWNVYTKDVPFAQSKHPLQKAFLHSYQKSDAVEKCLNMLTECKKKVLEHKTIPFHRDMLSEEVVLKKVYVPGREREHWDQPFLTSRHSGKIVLPCMVRDGILRCLFRVSFEPGLKNLCELTPYVVDYPGEEQIRDLMQASDTLVQVVQSEEGGRFFQEKNTIALKFLTQSVDEDHDSIWLTLGDIQALLLREGIFTNEARSALSLFLPWL